jgi:hypothetical protein
VRRSRCKRCKPSRATHKSGRASAQAVWLRRRRSSINEPIASPPSATTGMTKRALRIVPPHCRSDGKSTAAGNLNHLSRPDGSCLARVTATGTKMGDRSEVIRVRQEAPTLWSCEQVVRRTRIPHDIPALILGVPANGRYRIRHQRSQLVRSLLVLGVVCRYFGIEPIPEAQEPIPEAQEEERWPG